MNTKVKAPSHKRKFKGRKDMVGVKYTRLSLEIERLSGVDKKIVRKVLNALPAAILSLFDRATLKLKLVGLGHIEYRYRTANLKSRRESYRAPHWELVLHPEDSFVTEMTTLLGPPEHIESYWKAVYRRRAVVAERYAEIGGVPRFYDDPDVPYQDQI